MNNISKIIKGHNKKVTSKPRDQRPKCNCRKKYAKWNRTIKLMTQFINVTQQYQKNFGLAMEGEWKSRYYNHKLSLKHNRYSNMTTFSSYMWHLKSVSSETPDLKWSALRCVPRYSNTSKRCLLGFYKKLEIVAVLIKTRTRDLHSSVNVAMPTSSF